MINLDELVLLKPTNRLTQYGVNILENGNINLTGKLKVELAHKEIEIKISRDGNILVLNPTGEVTYRFPKGGSVKNDEVSTLLKKAKKGFPVHYNVKWDEEQKIWVGVTEKVGKIAPDK